MTTDRYKRLALLVLLLTTLTSAAWADDARRWRAEDMPVLDNTTRVMNPDGVLAAATVDSINSMLRVLDHHGVQPLVACVRRIEGDDPYEFAIALGRRFGVGGRQSLGMVMVLATDDRSYQIVTGEGMEKYLPDAICSRVEHEAMVPLLKQGEWDEALMAGVQMMKLYLEQDPELMEQIRQEEWKEEHELMVLMLIIVGGFMFVLLVALYRVWQEKKCPQCGKHKLQVVERKTYVDAKRCVHELLTLRCSHCGHTMKRDRIIRRPPSSGSAAATGLFFGSGMGGSRGGGFGSGGFGGGGGFGSFGGGSFGGGGAGGRF